jgi:hypothetical protein
VLVQALFLLGVDVVVVDDEEFELDDDVVSLVDFFADVEVLSDFFSAGLLPPPPLPEARLSVR